jgi:hypothetical protein
MTPCSPRCRLTQINSKRNSNQWAFRMQIRALGEDRSSISMTVRYDREEPVLRDIPMCWKVCSNLNEVYWVPKCPYCMPERVLLASKVLIERPPARTCQRSNRQRTAALNGTICFSRSLQDWLRSAFSHPSSLWTTGAVVLNGIKILLPERRLYTQVIRY